MTTLAFHKTYPSFFDFVSPAKNELIIISPYIKIASLRAILDKIEAKIKIIVVARWDVRDLVFGSSDLEVYTYLRTLGYEFYINNKVHMKVLVRDKEEILIGSANITASGLGFSERSNIEAIAIDTFDQKYLPDILSVIKNSTRVTDDIFKTLSSIVEQYDEKSLKVKEFERELSILQKSVFPKKQVLVSDFPFSISPEQFIIECKSEHPNQSAIHDLDLLKMKVTGVNGPDLKEAFLNSDAYVWQLNHVEKEILFGRYSELLHNALVDDPRPYRKQVKELVSNMFNWTKTLSDDFLIKQHSHTKSMIKKLV